MSHDDSAHAIDFALASYDEFLDFAFNHVPRDDPKDKWFWRHRPRVDVDGRVVVRFLTMMCVNSAGLLRRFTRRQIAEGLDFLFGAGGSEWFRDQLWNPDVPWPERLQCILAIPQLYFQVLETGEDFGIAFMLWDSIVYDYDSGARNPAGDAEDARAQAAMFAALCRMLESAESTTQLAAIHGLGHLKHAGGKAAIRSFLSSKSDLSPTVHAFGVDVLEDRFQ